MEQEFSDSMYNAASRINSLTFRSALSKMTAEELKTIHNELYQYDSVCFKLGLYEDGSTEWSDFYCGNDNFDRISNECFYAIMEGYKWIVFDSGNFFTFKNDDDFKTFILKTKVGELYEEYDCCFRHNGDVNKILLNAIFRK